MTVPRDERCSGRGSTRLIVEGFVRGRVHVRVLRCLECGKTSPLEEKSLAG